MSKKKEITDKIIEKVIENQKPVETTPEEEPDCSTAGTVFVPRCCQTPEQFDAYIKEMAVTSYETMPPDCRDIVYDDGIGVHYGGVSFFSKCEEFERRTDEDLFKALDNMPDGKYKNSIMGHYDGNYIPTTFTNKVNYLIYCMQAELMSMSPRIALVLKNIRPLNDLFDVYTFHIDNVLDTIVCAPIQYYYRIAMEFAQVIYNEILWAQLSYGHDKEFYEVTNGEVYALTNSMIPAFVTFLSMVAAEAKYYDDKRIISRNTINDLKDQGIF